MQKVYTFGNFLEYTFGSVIGHIGEFDTYNN